MNNYTCNVVDLTDNPTAKSVITSQLTIAPLSIALLFDLSPHDPNVIILDSIYTNGFLSNEKKSLILMISLLQATAEKLELQLNDIDSGLDFSEGDEFII